MDIRKIRKKKRSWECATIGAATLLIPHRATCAASSKAISAMYQFPPAINVTSLETLYGVNCTDVSCFTNRSLDNFTSNETLIESADAEPLGDLILLGVLSIVLGLMILVTVIENKVDLISLKYARIHQLPDLLQHIPWGIKVKFEHSLFEWQKSIGTYLPEDVPTNRNATQKSLEAEKSMEKILDSNSPQLVVIDLKSVLSNYNEGKSILKLIDLNVKELPEAQKQILVDKIVDFFIQNETKMSVALARTITNQILCLFPDEIKEYYFAPQTNKAPKGKLLAKYYNQIRKLKSVGLMDVPLSTKIRKHTTLPDLPEPEEDAIVMKEKLKFIQEYERWDEVRDMWQKCQYFRRKFLLEEDSKNIVNILTEWPCYKHPLGSSLIDLDFEMILPKAQSIYSKWNIFVNIAIHLFKNKVKDRNCKRILEELEKKTVSEGNVFVIAAILLERNLQNVANYLIVSLAVADLMVACLVMPLGAVYVISNNWIMGPELCDMWTSIDVLCCTASILHLVAIAVDRYWAVTNVDYIHTRNSNRIGIMIVVVWSIALVVSLSPQIPQFKDPDYLHRINVKKQCLVSQDLKYQIFATSSTFYVPLFVIFILYWKIFQTARKRIRRRRETNCQVGKNSEKTNNNSKASKGFLSKRKFLKMKMYSEKKSSVAEALVSSLVTMEGQSTTTSDDILEESEVGYKDIEVTTAFTISKPIAQNEIIHNITTEKSMSPPNNGSTNLQIDTRANTLHKDIPPCPASVDKLLPSRKEKKETLAAKRERKAAKTLAIITGAFVMCWLPFFILALLLPLCGDSCNISGYIMSFALWLGYFNSTLNPVIYTIFSPEFRQAFKRILCGGHRGGRTFRSGKMR